VTTANPTRDPPLAERPAPGGGEKAAPRASYRQSRGRERNTMNETDQGEPHGLWTSDLYERAASVLTFPLCSARPRAPGSPAARPTAGVGAGSDRSLLASISYAHDRADGPQRDPVTRDVLVDGSQCVRAAGLAQETPEHTARAIRS
jgi:hypothetical protein